MGVHASGDGAAWDSLESLDVDQPHGLDYRESVHMAKAVRKRLDQEHTTFGDSTAGGIHMPGGVAVLGMELTDDGGDITAVVVGDGTYRARGLVWAWDGSADARLWCSTKAAGNSTTGDWTLLALHPDKQWGGRDVTWAGDHEFGGDVDITGDVSVGGALYVDASADFSGAVNITGDVTINGSLKLSADMTITGDIAIDGTSNFTGDAKFAADVSIDGTTVLQDTVITGDSTFTFDPIAGETGPTFKILGDWSSRGQDTTYTARTDGFVAGEIIASGKTISLETPVGTVRYRHYQASGGNVPAQITGLVKKGDTWAIRVDTTTATASVLWLPFGDNT